MNQIDNMVLKVKASHRPARRYVLFEAESSKKIIEAIEQGLGKIGLAKVDPIIVSEKPIVIAVLNESLVSVRAACELSKDDIKISKVSGTLKGLS